MKRESKFAYHCLRAYVEYYGLTELYPQSLSGSWSCKSGTYPMTGRTALGDEIHFTVSTGLPVTPAHVFRAVYELAEELGLRTNVNVQLMLQVLTKEQLAELMELLT